MATVTAPGVEQDPQPRRRKAKTKPPSRWKRRLLVGIIALVGVVHAAPWVIAHTSLRNTLLSLALSEGQGAIASSGASLGWYSTIELSDIEIRDANDELIAEAASVRSSKTLLSLALDQSALGTFFVAQPKLHVESRADGSNIEDFIAPWLAPSETETGPIDVTVEVADGQIELVDATNGRRWDIQEVKTFFHLPADPTAAMRVELAANVHGGKAPAPLHARLTMPAEGMSEWKLKTSGLPLVAVRSAIERFAPGIVASGEVTTELAGSWDDQFSQAAVKGGARIDHLVLTGGPLGGDRLSLQKTDVPIDIELRDGAVVIRQLAAQCDVGTLQVSGALDLRPGETLPSLLGVGIRKQLDVQGRIDLARLASLLPGTLHIRQDTTIDSGELRLVLTGTTEQDQLSITGELNTSQIAATSAGRSFQWRQPVRATFSAQQPVDGLVHGKLNCNSDFLEIDVNGTPQRIDGTAEYDLDQLVAQLGQFVDFGEWRLTGKGNARFHATRDEQAAFEATAQLVVDNFELAGPDREAWTESHLVLDAEATGRASEGSLSQLATARLGILAGEDQLEVDLLKPVELGDDAVWPARARVQGDARRWLTRGRPWFELAGIAIDGACDVTAQASYSSKGIEVQQFQGSVRDLAIIGAGMNIREPEVRVAGQGTYDPKSAQLVLPGATLASGAVSLRGEKINVVLAESGPPRLAGQLQFNANLGKLQSWFATATHVSTTQQQFQGDAAGSVNFTHQGGSTTATTNVTVQNPAIIEVSRDAAGRTQRRTVWRDQQAKLSAAALYDGANDRLKMLSSQLEASQFTAEVAGTIDELTARQVLDLTGSVDYDLADFAPLLASYVGGGLQVLGRDQATFSVKGPLAEVATAEQPLHWSRRLAGQAGFGWRGASAYGMEMGPGRLSGKLQEGALRVDPLDVTVSGGRLTTAPWIKFDPTPSELLMPKGPLLTDLAITPAVSDQALKYVAPVLADATRTDGRFSVELEGGRIPLDAPEQSDVGGHLTIHRVEVMPGPLANQLILLAKQIEAVSKRRPPPLSLSGSSQALVNMQDQRVGFRLVQGRVYHDGLKMSSGEIVIRTRGSVGLDQTLALVAEVPLLDKWIGNEPALASLKGQSVPITIRGTFKKPQLDTRPVEQLAAQLVREAAQETITNEIGKQLDRLLRPR
jgi:hypothetical protein